MKVGNHNGWYGVRGVMTAAMLVIGTMSATTATAQLPSPIERFARLQGFGWGDGYNVCSDSGIRPLADLPPRHPFAGRHHGKLRGAASGLVHRAGATFYDHFDARNRTGCGCPTPCDGPCCDQAPITIIHGSEVTRGTRPSRSIPIASHQPHAINMPTALIDELNTPQVEPTTVVSQPPASIPAPVRQPRSKSDAATNRDRVAVTAPLSNTLKKYPIRPKPPVTKRQSLAFLGSARYPLPEAMIETDTQSLAQQSPTPSSTPGLILPVHPVPSETVAKAKVPPTTLPMELQQQPVIEPLPEVKPRTNRLVMPQPVRPSSVTPKASPPAYAAKPPVQQPPATARVVARPHRLGSSSAVVGETKTASAPRRPQRLGGATEVRANPFAARPTVELADRSESSDGVIRQPTRR